MSQRADSWQILTLRLGAPLSSAGVPEQPLPIVNLGADLPDWLGGLGDNLSNSEPAQPSIIPDWLSGAAEEKPAEPAPAATSSAKICTHFSAFRAKTKPSG